MIVGENVMSREIINPESLLNSKKYVDLTLSTLESLVSTVSSFNNNIFSISGLVESAKSDLKKSYDNLINTSYNICKTIIDFEEMPSDMSFEDMLAYILNNCGDSSELGLEQILALGLGFDSVVDQLGIKTQVIEMLEGKMTYEEFCQKLASGDEEATIIFNTTLLTAISKNYQEVIDSLEYDTIIISEDEAKLYIDLYNGSQMASFDQGFIQKLEDGTYKITGLDFIAGYDGTDIRGLYDEYIRNNPDSKLTFEEVEKFIGDILDRNANNNSELRQQQAVLEDGCYSIKQQLKLLPYIYISNQEGFDKYANQDYSSNLNDVTVDVKDALKFLSRNVDINYLTQDEIATFCYLYNEQGKKAADAYITAMEDAINSREAKESVEQYFLTGDPSLLSAGLRGVMDGTESFFEGIGDFFDPDDVRSLNDYEMMYMMQFLAMNYDMKTVEEQYAKGELSRHDYDVIKAVMDIDEKYRDNVLSTSYNVGMSVGNMLPSIVLSFVTQGLGGTLGASANAVGAAAKVLSSGSMFLSVAGNSLEGAYQDKAYINPMQAYLYAIAMGGTAAGSEFLLGNTVFSKNFDTGLKAVGKEVVQELFENVLGGELGAIIGEDYSIDDFFAEAGDTAITTLFSTLILNGGTRGLKITSDIASGKINLYTIVNPETGKTSIDWKLYNDSYAHMMNGEYDKVLNLALDSGNTSLAQSMVTTLLNNNDNGYFGDFVDLAMKNNSPELLIPLLNQDGGKSFQSFYEQMDDAAERSKVDSLLKSLVDSYDGTEKVSSNTESIPSTPTEKLVQETLEKMNKALEAKKVPSKSLDDIASIPSTPPEKLVEETLEKINKALEAKKVPSKSLDDIASIPSTPPEKLVEEILEKMNKASEAKKVPSKSLDDIASIENLSIDDELTEDELENVRAGFDNFYENELEDSAQKISNGINEDLEVNNESNENVDISKIKPLINYFSDVGKKIKNGFTVVKNIVFNNAKTENLISNLKYKMWAYIIDNRPSLLSEKEKLLEIKEARIQLALRGDTEAFKLLIIDDLLSEVEYEGKIQKVWQHIKDDNIMKYSFINYTGELLNDKEARIQLAIIGNEEAFDLLSTDDLLSEVEYEGKIQKVWQHIKDDNHIRYKLIKYTGELLNDKEARIQLALMGNKEAVNLLSSDELLSEVEFEDKTQEIWKHINDIDPSLLIHYEGDLLNNKELRMQLAIIGNMKAFNLLTTDELLSEIEYKRKTQKLWKIFLDDKKLLYLLRYYNGELLNDKEARIQLALIGNMKAFNLLSSDELLSEVEFEGKTQEIWKHINDINPSLLFHYEGDLLNNKELRMQLAIIGNMKAFNLLTTDDFLSEIEYKSKTQKLWKIFLDDKKLLYLLRYYNGELLNDKEARIQLALIGNDDAINLLNFDELKSIVDYNGEKKELINHLTDQNPNMLKKYNGILLQDRKWCLDLALLGNSNAINLLNDADLQYALNYATAHYDLSLAKSVILSLINSNKFDVLEKIDFYNQIALDGKNLLSIALEYGYIPTLTKHYATLKNVFPKFITFGANQGYFDSGIVTQQSSDIIDTYFPNMTLVEKSKLLKRVNNPGACTYASILNAIYMYYGNKQNGEELFKKSFGYDMYNELRGLKILNDGALLLDLFCFANKDNGVIVKNEDSYSINAEEIAEQFYFQTDMYEDGTIYTKLCDFLSQKTGEDISSKLQYYGTTLSRTKTGDLSLEKFTQLISSIFSNGQNTVLDLAAIGNNQIIYHGKNDEIMRNSGHSTYVYGIDINSGTINLSSWGNRMYLKISELYEFYKNYGNIRFGTINFYYENAKYVDFMDDKLDELKSEVDKIIDEISENYQYSLVNLEDAIQILKDFQSDEANNVLANDVEIVNAEEIKKVYKNNGIEGVFEFIIKRKNELNQTMPLNLVKIQDNFEFPT